MFPKQHSTRKVAPAKAGHDKPSQATPRGQLRRPAVDLGLDSDLVVQTLVKKAGVNIPEQDDAEIKRLASLTPSAALVQLAVHALG